MGALGPGGVVGFHILRSRGRGYWLEFRASGGRFLHVVTRRKSDVEAKLVENIWDVTVSAGRRSRAATDAAAPAHATSGDSGE